MADFTKFGDNSPRVVIYKSESHKLHQAFAVKAETTVLAGNPVAITADGTIELLTAANVKNYLGIAVTDNVNPAYKESRNAGPVEVTVAVQGYIVLNAVAEAALDAGPVEVGTGMDDTKRFTKFKTATADTQVNFISLNKATEAGEMIQVLCK